MNFRMILFLLGRFMWVSALLLALPLAVALYYGETTTWAFIVPILGLLACGTVLGWRKPKNTAIYAKEGFFIVSLGWILLSLFGALPFYLSGHGLSYLDCVFETVSGLTTTGSSILTDVEIMTRGILFWRSFTHWVGGMGVLVFMLAILPQSDSHFLHLMRAEMPGHQVDKLVSKVKSTAVILYRIYVAMTLVQIILLILGGMPVFDSILNSFGTAGTGGFAIKNASIGYYNNAYFDIVIGVFMVLFGINFNLFYLIVVGNFMQALKSEELHAYLSIIAAAVIAIAINIAPRYTNFAQSIRYSFFQVSSIITTTGYATDNFDLWPSFSKAILVLLMFIGACAGSTGGGLKISRLVILFKTALREIKQLLSPRSVSSIRFEQRPLDALTVQGVNAFFIVHMMLTAASVLLLTLDNINLVTAFTAVAACINNVGPGLDLVGPASNFSSLSDLSTSVLIFDMLAGRLEFFPVLMLFSPSAWKGR